MARARLRAHLSFTYPNGILSEVVNSSQHTLMHQRMYPEIGGHFKFTFANYTNYERYAVSQVSLVQMAAWPCPDCLTQALLLERGATNIEIITSYRQLLDMDARNV